MSYASDSGEHILRVEQKQSTISSFVLEQCEYTKLLIQKEIDILFMMVIFLEIILGLT